MLRPVDEAVDKVMLPKQGWHLKAKPMLTMRFKMKSCRLVWAESKMKILERGERVKTVPLDLI